MFTEDYEKKLKGNSLILTECEEPEVINEFEERMITENDIRGFLPCRQVYENGKRRFSYDITSKQSLAHLFEERELSEKDIKKIIKGIIGIRSVLEEYLLSEENVILNPKYIFADPETKIPVFVFYPYYGINIHSSLLGLGTYLLERTDHTDDMAVKLVYGFYKKVVNEDYAFETLLYDLKEDNLKDEEREVYVYSQSEQTNEKYVAEEDEYIKTTNIEKAALIISSCTLTLLITFILLARYTDILQLAHISREMVVIICGIIGTMSIATPAAILISRQRQSEKLSYFKNIENELMEKKDVIENKRKSDIKQWGKTGKISVDDSIIRRLVGYRNDKVIEYSLKSLPYIIGKDKNEADGILCNESASRIHAKISFRRGEYYITDLNSTNGTSVNGRMLSTNESVKIKENDEISFAGEVFYFR